MPQYAVDFPCVALIPADIHPLAWAHTACSIRGAASSTAPRRDAGPVRRRLETIPGAWRTVSGTHRPATRRKTLASRSRRTATAHIAGRTPQPLHAAPKAAKDTPVSWAVTVRIAHSIGGYAQPCTAPKPARDARVRSRRKLLHAHSIGEYAPKPAPCRSRRDSSRPRRRTTAPQRIGGVRSNPAMPKPANDARARSRRRHTAHSASGEYAPTPAPRRSRRKTLASAAAVRQHGLTASGVRPQPYAAKAGGKDTPCPATVRGRAHAVGDCGAGSLCRRFFRPPVPGNPSGQCSIRRSRPASVSGLMKCLPVPSGRARR